MLVIILSSYHRYSICIPQYHFHQDHPPYQEAVKCSSGVFQGRLRGQDRDHFQGRDRSAGRIHGVHGKSAGTDGGIQARIHFEYFPRLQITSDIHQRLYSGHA